MFEFVSQLQMASTAARISMSDCWPVKPTVANQSFDCCLAWQRSVSAQALQVIVVSVLAETKIKQKQLSASFENVRKI